MAQAQLSLAAVDTPYTQNFDGLASSGTPTWTDNSTLPGWYYTRSPTAATTYSTGSGSGTGGSLYSFGVAGTNPATDRALGSLASSGNTYYYGVRLVNNTGVTITSLAVAYTGEQWRVANATAQKLQFQYQIAAAGTITAINNPSSGWTAATNLDFTSPVTNATASALDGNAAANRTSFNQTLSLNVPAGQEVWLRWVDTDDSGSDDALAIDDFSVTANPIASTPPSGVGNASPNSVLSGTTSKLTVAVSPGSNPTSTFVDTGHVSVDLSQIGGSATQTFYDDGTNGDSTAGNGTYTYTATVTAAPGNYTLPATITDDQARTGSTSISLTVLPPPTQLTIMQIQGKGTGSAYAGASGAASTNFVATDPTRTNVVTVLKSNGFYMQDYDGDGDTTTSDGIFVFTGSAPTVVVGDVVNVTAKVQEFRGSTQLTSAMVSKTGSGHALPAAYDLSLPANYPSHDPTQGVCKNAAIVLPAAGYQANNFACLDGMLVTTSNGLAVTAVTGNLSYSTTPVSDGVHPNNVQYFYATADGTRPFRSPGIPYPGDASRPDIPVYNNAPEAFEIYYPGLNFNAANFVYNAGTTFQTTGIMAGFTSSTTGGVATIYEIYPTSMTTLSTPTYPVVVATPEPGKLTVGTQNMLHFFNASNDDKNDSSQYTDTCSGDGSTDQCPTPAEYGVRLQKMSKQIRVTLKAPIVQVVQELENYSTLVDLANQIHTDDATLTYVPYSIRSNDPGGINIGILVRSSVTVNSVTQFFRDTKVLDACNPSFPTPCLLNDRPPVLLDASYQGYRFRVLAIYHRSLGSLAKTGYVGQKRMEQAVQVAGLIQMLQTTGQSATGNTQQAAGGVSTDGSYLINGDATIPLLVLGDFNAYEFNDGFVDVTGIIMGTAVTNNPAPNPCPSYYCPLNAMDPAIGTYTAPNPVLFDTGTASDPNVNYSYTFNAYSQEIDHIVITQQAQQDFVRISHAHGNADVSDSADANNPYGALMLDPTTPVRTSDHDGQVVTLGYVVTPSTDANSTISASTVQTVGKNAQPTFTITPATGYTATVGGSCGTSGQTSGTSAFTYTVNAVSADCTVSVTSTPISYTVSSSAGSGGSIGQAQTVAYGNTALFAITPDAGHHMTTVTDDCGDAGANSNPSYSGGTYVTGPITHACTVTASFYINSYLVKTSVTGAGGHISAPAMLSVDYNSTTSFTAVPDTGYHLASAVGDTCTASVASNTITTGAITDYCTISVTFALDPVNGACGSANGGTFTSLASNDASLCSAGTAANFTGGGPWTWTCNGTNGGSPSPTCTANIKTWNVTTTGSGAGGTISAPAAATVNNGGATTFTVTANSDYAIDTVTGNTCTPALQSGNTYTTGPITADCTITATFVRVAGYVPLNPSRILDTRSIGVTSDGQFAKGGAVTGGHSIDLTVLGRGGIPASGVKAVVLNVTATGTTAASYVTVWPTGGSVPHASNLNIFPGQNNTNLVIVEVGTGGNVSLFNALGAVDLIADVQGYFSDASDMTALVPARFLDTRSIGVTVDGQFQKGGALTAQTQLDLGVNGRAGIPSTGVGSVILNVTATGTTAPGYVTVWPTDGPAPHTSNLNFVAAQTIPNLVISKVSNDGKVSLFNSAGNTDLIADAMGWFPANSELTSIDPARVLDTRADIGVTIDNQFAGEGPVAPGGTLDLIVTGRGGVPLSGVSAVVLNVTVTGPTASGYLTAWPTGSTRPLASNLNFVAYQTVPNLVIVKVGNSGAVSLFNSAGHSDIVVDVVGWFASP